MRSIKNTREGQEIAEVVTDAECKIGELIREIPKATKGTGNNQYKRNAEISPHVEFSKSKSSVLKENGISQRQAEHFQSMIHLLIHHDSLIDSE